MDYDKQRQAAKAARIKKRKRQQRLFYGGCAAVLALLILGIVLLVKGCSGGGMPDELQGRWRYDPNTVYEFQTDGTGCMELQGSTRYAFTCTVKGDTLKMDFEQTHITDCEYTFAIEGDTLTLTGGKGTVAEGTVYTLMRE